MWFYKDDRSSIGLRDPFESWPVLIVTTVELIVVLGAMRILVKWSRRRKTLNQKPQFQIVSVPHPLQTRMSEDRKRFGASE